MTDHNHTNYESHNLLLALIQTADNIISRLATDENVYMNEAFIDDNSIFYSSNEACVISQPTLGFCVLICQKNTFKF